MHNGPVWANGKYVSSGAGGKGICVNRPLPRPGGGGDIVSIGSARRTRDPYGPLVARVECNCREVPLRRNGRRLPCGAAVVGECEVRPLLVCFLVVPACDDSVFGIAKGNREDAGRIATMCNRRVVNGPGFTVILRLKDAGGFPASGKPQVVLTFHGQARTAGREGPFAVDCIGKPGRRDGSPVLAAIVGHQDFEFPVDRISDGHAVSLIPKRRAIQKTLRVLVGELQRPVLSGISRFVNTRQFSWPGTEKVGDIGAEGLNIAEVELLRADNLRRLPGVSVIETTEVSSMGTTGPNDALGSGTDAPQILRGI